MSAELARGLVTAEERLRAAGLTGAQAFDALEAALRERMGHAVDDVHPEARQAVEALPAHDADGILGLAYERFFADLFKGRHGQYFTPPPLVRLLVRHLGLQSGERVLDPACGSGGLLVAAARAGAVVEGLELDPRLARLGALNLALAGAGGVVRQADMFTAEVAPADAVLANPPFSVPIRDPAALERFDAPAGVLSDVLFLRALPHWVRPGGRAGLVMPLSLLANPRWAAAREGLEAHFLRERVVTLPEGVFRPFGGAAGRAVLVWLRRRGAAPDLPLPTRWASLSDPGYDPRSQALKRTTDDEVEALMRGEGFRPVEGWLPEGEALEGRPLTELARLRRERVGPARGDTQRLDLADVDRVTGEARPRTVEGASLSGTRWRLAEGDVLVSRLRPALGNVVVAPVEAVGSPEWVVLNAPRWGHYLWLALRTPAWRAQLPLASGQTRPRTTAEAVLSSRVPWPDDEDLVDAIDAEVAAVMAERRALQGRLERLEAAMAHYAAQGDADVLRRALEPPMEPRG